MPILLAWEGAPSVINPVLAGATKRKTDVLDAERFSFHDLTGVWKDSYIPSKDIQELRVLIAERNHFSKLATQCSNRINNTIVRFDYTIGRGISVTKNRNVRDIIENIVSDTPADHENLCPFPLPDDVRAIIRQEYELYDFYSENEKLYLSKVRDKALSMNSDTKKRYYFRLRSGSHSLYCSRCGRNYLFFISGSCWHTTSFPKCQSFICLCWT